MTLAASGGALAAGNDAALQALFAQANYWHEKSHDELAMESLQKVLSVHISNGLFMANNGYEFALAMLLCPRIGARLASRYSPASMMAAGLTLVIGSNIASNAISRSSTYNGLTINRPWSWPSSDPL